MLDVNISPVLSIWVQLGSFCFTMSALFTDLLLLRFWLLAAYTFLFLNAVLGSALWPAVYRPSYLSLDGLIWATIGIYCHIFAFTSLLLDERHVHLEEHTGEAPLWRMFYRSGGISARLFKSIISKRFHIVEYEAGQIIPTKEHFYILYTGHVKFQILDGASRTPIGNSSHTDATNGNNHHNINTRHSILYNEEAEEEEEDTRNVRGYRNAKSGDMFDLKHISSMACDQPIFEEQELLATSITKTKLFCFHHNDIATIGQNPLSKNIWQSLLIVGLSSAVQDSGRLLHETTLALHRAQAQVQAQAQQQQHQQEQPPSNDSIATPAPPPPPTTTTSNTVVYDMEPSPIFRPLDEEELPVSYLAGSNAALKSSKNGVCLIGFLRHYWHYAKQSFVMPWAHLSGIRQTSLPAPQTTKTDFLDATMSMRPQRRSTFLSKRSHNQSNNNNNRPAAAAVNSTAVAAPTSASASLVTSNQDRSSTIELPSGGGSNLRM